MSTNPSSEERLMAAIAHASVVVFGPGILVGVFIWLTQKEKAAYASNQGLQAAVFQLIGMIVTMAMWFVWGIFYALTWIPFVQNPELLDGPPPPIFWIGMISMVVPLLAMLVWSLYGLWGALQAFRGRDFRYAIIGNLLPSK
jgi:magnesium-transporting ATPase (P-type)